MSGEKEKKLFIETYGCQMNVADSCPENVFSRLLHLP